MMPDSALLEREQAVPRRRIRVLQVIQNLNYGGMERLLADIVLRADPERFESHVLVLEYLGRFAEGLEGRAGLHVADPMSRWSMVWPGPLIRNIRAIAPDVVHSHSGVWYKASMAARMAGVPLFLHTEHGRQPDESWQARLVDRLAARRTDVVVAVSEPLKRLLIEKGISKPGQTRVIINGVDTDSYRPRPDSGVLRRERGLAPDVPILGSIGRLEAVKGYDIMVDGFARLRGAWPGPQAPVLVLCGEGSERARLEAMAAERGVAHAVHFLGWRDDVHDLHSAFTLFTMSSRSEGTSVSLLEAMSASLCPVVTHVGGNAAVLGPDLAHRLVRPTDPDALAAAWREALTDMARRQQDGATARARVQHAFALSSMVKGYEEIYATVAPRLARRTA